MAIGDSYQIGSISIGTSLDLSQYRKNRQALIADANKLADEIGQRLSNSISGSFSGAGRGLADSLSRDFPRQGGSLQQSLGSTISGAVFRANIATAISGELVSGIVRAGSLITRPLQDIVSTITGAIGQGLDFGNAARIRTEVLSTASALSGVAKIGFEEAEGAIESLNESLAASAAALPGSTDAFLQVARQVSDELARVAVDAEGIFDPQRWEQMTSRLATSATVLGEASGVNAGLTSMGLSRALSGTASISEMRQLNLFQNNPTLLSEIERQLQQIGAESLRDVTAAGRVNILQAAFDTVVTPELIEQASNSAEGLIEAFRSRLGDPTTGLFSISRELSATGASVFDTLTETLRLTIAEGSGLFDRFAASAEDAGLRIGDPMEALQSVILRLNEAIANLAQNTDRFFSSDLGQQLVSIVNTLQTRVPQVFAFLIRLGGEILPVVISGLQTVARVADSAFNAIASAIPDFSGIGLPDLGDLSLSLDVPDLRGVTSAIASIGNGLALARDYALSFFEAFSANVDISGLFDAGLTALEGFNSLMGTTSTRVNNFIRQNSETIRGVGETLGEAFGAGVTAVSNLARTLSETLVPIIQRLAGLASSAIGAVWDGLRPLREWLADDQVSDMISGAIAGLGRIAEFLVQRVGVALLDAIDRLDAIFIQSGLIERVFTEIGRVIQIIITAIGGILQIVGRWGEITEAVSGTFNAIAEIIQLRIREAMTNVIGLVSDRFRPQIELVQGIFSSIAQTVERIWSWLDRTFSISERLAGPFEVVKAIAEQIVGHISTIFGGLQRILGLQPQAQPTQAFQPGGTAGGFASPLQGQSLQQVVHYQQSAGQDFDAYRAYRQGYHAGIDFDARVGGGEGGIVQSVTDGVVTEINELFSNAEGAGGSVQVRIETTDSTGQTVQQRYTHLSRQAVQEAGLQAGQQVSAGQVIGAVGSTDSVSSGAHLDYKVTVNGQFVNPDEFLSLAGAAGQLTTLDVRSGQQGQVNIGAIATQARPSGIGGQLAGGLTSATAVLGQNIDPVYSGLLQRFGGDRTIASAFYGNFAQESGLDTTAVNEIGASGLAQWLGSRREELQAFADQMGKEWTDLDVQLDFVLRELETSESAAWEKIREVAATGDVAATTKAVRVYYERPGEHEAADDRRIAAAQQAFAQTPQASAPTTQAVDLSQFLDPTQRAARELAEAQRILGRESQLRAQARQDEDRAIALEREQRVDSLRARQAELAPTDTTGSTLIDAQIRALQISDQISDRMLQNERAITDLIDARENQRRQRVNLEAQRSAFEQAQVTGAPATTTEEELRELEAGISPVDFDAAIANLRNYGQELDALREDKLRPIQASLSQFATRAVEDSRNVLRSVAELNRQYSDPSAFEQHQAAIANINLSYEENAKNLDQTISNLQQLNQVENLSDDQYEQLAQQLQAATIARENLTAAEERAIAITNETYEAQQRLATINLAEQLLQPQLRAAEAEAQSIERFDQFGANAIRRQTAIATLGIRFAEEIEAINNQTTQLLRQFEQAQAAGDQASLDQFQALGITSTEDIERIGAQSEAAVNQVYTQELQVIADQFPTVADAFRNSLRDATSQGLTEGFRGLASGDIGVGEFFGNLFNTIADSVIGAGAQRLSDLVTGGLFDNGEGGGLLGGILGANEDSIPGQAQEASAILDQGGLAAGQRMIDSAIAAADILAGGGGALGFGSVDLGGDGGPAPLLGGIAQTATDLLGGGSSIGETVSGLLNNADGLSFGSIVAEGFQERMPEAGSVLAGGQGQGFLGSVAQGLGSLFGRGGGTPGFSGGSLLGGSGGGGRAAGTIGTILGIVSSFFADGGYVGNMAGGGIASAMARERSASGRSPRLAVVNDGEFIFRSEAVDRIGVSTLNAMNQGGYIPNYAIGGSIAERTAIDPPIFGQYQVPIESNTRPQKIEHTIQSQIINNVEYVSRDQLDVLQNQINQAPEKGAAFALEALRSSPSARNRAGV